MLARTFHALMHGLSLAMMRPGMMITINLVSVFCLTVEHVDLV